MVDKEALGKNVFVNDDGTVEEYVFGIDKDLSDKMKAKHDPEKQEQAQAWVEAMINETFPSTGNEDADYHNALRDGTKLIKVLKKINKTYGGQYDIPKSTSAKALAKKKEGGIKTSKQRENVAIYLEVCKQSIGKDKNGKKIKGMKESDMFVTCDLFDNNNMDVVTDQIHCLGGKVQKLWNEKTDSAYDGPLLGTVQSSENKREFTEEQLAEAKKIVPLQNAGSIKVEKNKSTDNIIMSTEQSVDTSGISQQNGGAISYSLQSGLDSIDRSGGQTSVDKSGISQVNSGSIAIKGNKKLDQINRNQNTTCSTVESQLNQGSIKQEHTTTQDSLTRGNN